MDEKSQASIIDKKLHEPLNAHDDAAMAKRFLEGGYGQSGYGVGEGASVDGSFAIDSEGDQGYYTRSGRDIFLKTVDAMKEFFTRRAERLGKPVRYVIKPGIGGQHTPFQAIADSFAGIDPRGARITGEYELGKDYESAIAMILKELGAGWDQIALIPSSKSGSTDETMLIFSEILYIMFKHISAEKGMDGEKFAGIVFNTMHDVNFTGGAERPGKDLFKGFSLSLVTDKVNNAGLKITREEVKSIFGKVLGNMFFETTDRPQASRLSAFIRNSGLDKELGADAPGFGAMFDNVGGRWTADLHMMTFLAYHGLDANSYWASRYEGIKKVREGRHAANELADKILDGKITDIALVIPDALFWFGKAIEQNFNESIWQDGFANLIAVKNSLWPAQKRYYINNPTRLVIDKSDFNIPQDKQKLVLALGELFTLFYGMTHVVGNRLIARVLTQRGCTSADVDMSDLDNSATRILQENLYLRQPYVELGKGLLEKRLKTLQQKEEEKTGAINLEFTRIKHSSRERGIESNISELRVPAGISNGKELAVIIKDAMRYAAQLERKFVSFIYLEGDKFYSVRDYLISLGIEWVMQGTGDQHISYQQVLARPGKYLPFIISFVPERPVTGRAAIGFAKGYLNNVSPNMVRDSFAQASYKALTELRKSEGGLGIFMRMSDSDIDMLKKVFKECS